MAAFKINNKEKTQKINKKPGKKQENLETNGSGTFRNNLISLKLNKTKKKKGQKQFLSLWSLD